MITKIPMIQDPWQLASIKPNPRFVGMDREQIAQAIQYLFRIHYTESDNNEYGNHTGNYGECLYWTHAACTVLRMAGYRAILQAGTMNWLINPNPDAPITHFTYQWEPESEASKARIVIGVLPEIHIWCALPDLNEIVDFSTCDFRKVAESTHALKWHTEDPPSYLWCNASQLPEGVHYKAELEAIRFIFKFLQDHA